MYLALCQISIRISLLFRKIPQNQFSNNEEQRAPMITGSVEGVNPKLIERKRVRDELDRMLQLPGNNEPDRGDMDKPEIEWRYGKPNYTAANLAYLQGKCQSHEKGSLEMIVENAVKTWKMEASHKKNTSQWSTIVHEKYNVQGNGGKKFYLEEASTRGNYNVLMDAVDPALYDASSESYESSYELFRKAFNGSFPWEVLKVFAGPPNLVFSFRHWSEFVGEYQGHRGDRQLIEMIGFAQVIVTSELKITDIRVFYNPEAFLKTLRGEKVAVAQKSSEPSFADWLGAQNISEGDVVTPTLIMKAESELAHVTAENKQIDRGVINDTITWKNGKPNFALVDLAFYKGKLTAHVEGSAEQLISNLVKRCGIEMSHIKDKQQWKALIGDGWKMEVNGSDVTNLLNSFEKVSAKTFNGAFPWEVTEVFSKAPEIAFSWRHWMNVKGESMVELSGYAIVQVSDDFQIESIKLFYKPQDVPEQFRQASGKCPFAVFNDAE